MEGNSTSAAPDPFFFLLLLSFLWKDSEFFLIESESRNTQELAVIPIRFWLFSLGIFWAIGFCFDLACLFLASTLR